MISSNMWLQLSSLAIVAVCCFSTASADNFAVLIAGSNTYTNYRHQADICHAYHLLVNHGLPKENIIVFMYDDIAHNPQNPIKGNIINWPNGTNVYPGVKIDYKGDDVNPDVFVAVLEGDEKEVKKLTGKKGRVLKSTKNDHVFVNFADHGAPGLLGFPDSILGAQRLKKTIMKMHQQEMYKKMVWYVEACESGSMFDNNLLPANMSVYAATAANPFQSSWACFMDPFRNTYLADLWSIGWMHDSDQENLNKETLKKQFRIVRNETVHGKPHHSNPHHYGDLSIMQMAVAEFQGKEECASCKRSDPNPLPPCDGAQVHKLELEILRHKYRKAADPATKREASAKIRALLDGYGQIEDFFNSIVRVVGLSRATESKDDALRFRPDDLLASVSREQQSITQWDCYEGALEAVTFACPGLGLSQNYYALRHLRYLVNLCERGYPSMSLRTAVAAASHNNPLCLRKQ